MIIVAITVIGMIAFSIALVMTSQFATYYAIGAQDPERVNTKGCPDTCGCIYKIDPQEETTIKIATGVLVLIGWLDTAILAVLGTMLKFLKENKNLKTNT